jgi:hypothetical protein
MSQNFGDQQRVFNSGDNARLVDLKSVLGETGSGHPKGKK